MAHSCLLQKQAIHVNVCLAHAYLESPVKASHLTLHEDYAFSLWLKRIECQLIVVTLDWTKSNGLVSAYVHEASHRGGRRATVTGLLFMALQMSATLGKA